MQYAELILTVTSVGGIIILLALLLWAFTGMRKYSRGTVEKIRDLEHQSVVGGAE